MGELTNYTYDELCREAAMETPDEEAHAAYVRKVAEEHGFPMPNWKPIITGSNTSDEES